MEDTTLRKIKRRLSGMTKKMKHSMKQTGTNVDRDCLSQRELEVLRKMADGMKTVVIADVLFISPNTVQAHRRNIFRKMGVSNGIGAVSKGLKEGLI